MTGRQEHDEKIKNRVLLLIKNEPQYVQDYYYNFGDKTSTTTETYVRHVVEFANFYKGKDLATLKKIDVNRFLESIRYRTVNGERVERSVASRNVKLAAIRNFYEFLLDNEIIESNPCATIKPAKSGELKTPVFLTPKEIKKVEQAIIDGVSKYKSNETRDALRKRDLAIFLLGCTTGLRRTAITEIDVSDVDLDEGTIRVVEKGNKERIIHLGEKTIEAIDEWMTERDYFPVDIITNALFVTRRGKRISGDDIASMLKKYTEGIGKHISPHKMRSTCATNLYDKTSDIYLVQEVLGHSNIANTRRYARVNDDKKKHAADVMDKLV